jgi:predicted dehydrogenase
MNDLEDSYFSEWNDFLSAIDEKSSPLVSLTDGVKTMRLIQAIRQSSESGNRVWVGNEDHLAS